MIAYANMKTLSMVIMLVMIMASGVVSEPSPSQLASAPAENVGFEVGQLYVRSHKPDETPRVFIGAGAKSYSFGINTNGDFSIAVNANGTKTNEDIVTLSKDTLSASNILARTVHADQIVIRGVPQWTLLREDIFANPAASMLELQALPNADKQTGWVSGSTLACAGLSMLAVEGSDGNKKKTIEKVYANLPPHTQLRVVATGHFVDDWQGETAYLTIDNHMVWTESHDQRAGLHALSICGSDRYPETKFSTPIDITIPHTADKVQLSFGTTLESSAEARFGISSVAIYARNVPKV